MLHAVVTKTTDELARALKDEVCLQEELNWSFVGPRTKRQEVLLQVKSKLCVLCLKGFVRLVLVRMSACDLEEGSGESCKKPLHPLWWAHHVQKHQKVITHDLRTEGNNVSAAGIRSNLCIMAARNTWMVAEGSLSVSDSPPCVELEDISHVLGPARTVGRRNFLHPRETCLN